MAEEKTEGLSPEETVERKSYKKTFFLGIVLLAFSLIWTLYDEVYSRRPWKAYQRSFYDQEYQKAKEHLKEVNESLTGNPEYQTLLTDLKAAQEGFNKPDVQKKYQEALKAYQEASIRHFEIRQEFGFSKAEQEEAFYNWKHAVQTGHGENHLREEWEKLVMQTDALLSKVNEAEREKQEAKERVDQFTEPIDPLTEKKEEMEAELKKAEFTFSTTYDVLDLSLFKLKLSKSPDIKQVVIPKVERVDRCHSCHTAMKKEGNETEGNPFKTHPNKELFLDNHPLERFGCTLCHQGQGPALATVKAAHGEIQHWEEPLYKSDKVQSSCRKCHTETLNLEGAPLLNAGEKAIIQFGCFGCHDIEGFNHYDKVGPDLRKMGIKLRPEWVYSWVKEPKAYASHTKMPNFLLTDEEVASVVAYLFNVSDNEGKEHFRSSKAEGDPQRGEELFKSVGCMACHKINGQGVVTSALYTRQFAPDLGKVGSKTNPAWIEYWLKNPKAYHPKTKMPNMRLTEQDRKHLAAYLITLKGEVKAPEDLKQKMEDPDEVEKGRKLIATYGCYGCHEIKGMKELSKVSVELSSFGDKMVDELAFGDRVDIPETWEGWTFNKLKNPRAYQTEAVIQRMPQFSLTDEEATAIITVLRSFKEEKIHPDFVHSLEGQAKDIEEGRWLVWFYNCTGCHIIEGKGGDIRALYEDKALAPPPLYDEGQKVQPNWLYGFVKEPTTLRPWLKVRMPNFQFNDAEDKDATTISKYFLALGNIKSPFIHVQKPTPEEANIAEGKELFEKLKCLQCHQLTLATELSPSDLAPDLAMARQRLRPEWIEQWLINPQILYPGTRMPTYFPREDEEDPESPLFTPILDILDGEALKQIKAIRDYLLVLDQNTSEKPVEGG